MAEHSHFRPLSSPHFRAGRTDLLAQECKDRRREADKLAVAESRILDESEKEAAGLPVASSRLGYTLGKHRIPGWLEEVRCSWLGNTDPERPAEVDYTTHTAVGPLGPPQKHAAQLLGLTSKSV